LVQARSQRQAGNSASAWRITGSEVRGSRKPTHFDGGGASEPAATSTRAVGSAAPERAYRRPRCSSSCDRSCEPPIVDAAASTAIALATTDLQLAVPEVKGQDGDAATLQNRAIESPDAACSASVARDISWRPSIRLKHADRQRSCAHAACRVSRTISGWASRLWGRGVLAFSPSAHAADRDGVHEEHGCRTGQERARRSPPQISQTLFGGSLVSIRADLNATALALAFAPATPLFVPPQKHQETGRSLLGRSLVIVIR
jgi:hypothetical protein